jgi:ABC-type transport system involved in multi-copper enzyme maturation permease subunit
MKFIAILKDSLRETLDVKLFYVMVTLSLLTILLVLSVTYKPAPMERQLEFATNIQNARIRAKIPTNKFTLRTEVENFERTDDRTEPWLGNYAFDYVVRWGFDLEGAKLTPEERKEFQQAREMFKRDLTAESLRRQLEGIFQEVKVTELPPNKDLPEGTDEIGFRVVTTGTKVKSRREWVHEPALFFGLVPIPVPVFPLASILKFIVEWPIGAFGAAFTLVISIIVTASFLPNMLSKGTIDLLLVKPIHRVSLFVEKFLGGLLFMFLNTVVIMTGVWLALGIQAGAWLPSLLMCIFIYTFQFAIIYSMSALTAVLTRSTIVCILISFMTWGFLFAFGWAHWLFIEGQRPTATPETKSHWAFVGFDTLYTISPRYKDIDWLTSKMIEKDLIRPRGEAAESGETAEDRKLRQERAEKIYDDQLKSLDKRFGTYSWASSLTVTSLFIAVVLGLACWRFAVKDY